MDYTEYLIDRICSTPFEHAAPSSYSHFGKPHKCPFCRSEVKSVFSNKEEMRASGAYEIGIISSAHQCIKCGWWKSEKYDWKNDSGRYWDIYTSKYAILKRYDPFDLKTPIDALRRYITLNPNIIHGVDPYKTEKLIGSVLADFFDCEVRFVGKSGDKGIDLYLVIGESEILVQVKNRVHGSKNWKTEPLSTIWEFLGALFYHNATNSILVSTANKFSSGAKSIANKMTTERKLQQFDLIDGKEFFKMLSLTTPTIPNHWQDNVWPTELEW